MAAGAWIDGEKYGELNKATLGQANREHGKFDGGVRKGDA
jgi:hypothetical protein